MATVIETGKDSNVGIIKAPDVDARALAAELRGGLKGEVRFDDGSRALYATDGSNYRQVPIGVVIPRDKADIEAAVAACRRYGAPILSRGGGTSLTGGCCNVAVVMDMSKYYNHILWLDPGKKQARVQPGVVLDTLRMKAEEHHLTFAPDPSTHNHCCLGGMMGNNSCGVHSMMGGRTVDNVDELEILTYDGVRMTVGRTSDEEYERIVGEGGRRGEIYARLRALRDRYGDLIRARYPKIPRRVSGYSLDELLPENGFHVARSLIGTESTCVTFLEATCRLVDSPPMRTLLVVGFPDIATAGDHIMQVVAHGPVGLEGIDDVLIRDMKTKGIHPKDVPLVPEGGGWLMVEFGGQTQDEADDKARKLMAELKTNKDVVDMRLFDDKKQEKMLWEVREAGLGATARIPGQPDAWEGWEDSAVPPEKVGPYLRDLRKLLTKHGYNCSLYGHLGQGCIHTRIDFEFRTADGVKNYRAFMYEAADLVLSYGGSLSGEHGDGQSRAELLPKMFGPELIEAFREFKSIWDPDWKMNPGKKVDAYRIDENLRMGPTYSPPQLATHFQFPDDKGSFSYATERCVGVGLCRRDRAGTMCPSYMVTKEEMHSTRGRTHLLFEMLQQDPMQGMWRNESVREALDLCLACKGCKGDCPLNVDMATYKAEFLSHYYEGRLRPITAYSMGLVYWWARLGSLVPGVVNFLTQTPVIRDVMKMLGGISVHRSMPPFAPESFKSWFARRVPHNLGRQQVLLWPDTFNNYFHPEVAKAAVEVLEHAGFHVVVPRASLCCGRPLYDHGMLDTAKGLLRQIMDTLRPEIEAGVPIVGLEPSCVAVFRDELGQLFPMDEDAKRLGKQVFLLSEFLERQGYEPPKLERKAVVHGHCHHKSVMKFQAEESVLKKLGLDFEVLDSGCCGMAGSFGFEADHYDISMKVGEHKLLPALREVPKDALIISDGFSCKHQVFEATDRRALHLAQVLQMAIHEGPHGVPGPYPERRYPEVDERRLESSSLATVAALGAGVLLGGALIYALKRRRIV